jgi:peptidylprolyl isomerase
MTTVESGDRVQVHYTGKLEDGTVFDRSTDGEPLAFTAGDASGVIEGLSQAVLGMTRGETRTITVPPGLAYGERKPGLDREVPRALIPEGVQEGDPVRANTEEGPVVVWVLRLDEATAQIDANHPLAGHTLTFDLELVSVDKAV